MSLDPTYTIPQAVTLSTAQVEKIEECLDEFARNTGAQDIFLTDMTGQLIEFRGRSDKKKAEALAALIAGSYAASSEFIKLLGKDTPFVNLLHEAEDYSVYSTNVADALILNVVFGTEVKVGIVRVFLEQARRALSDIVHEAPVANSKVVNNEIRLVDDDFDQLLDKELEKITDRKG
jgi:predicted regulator of Ras-like GTPase activity (Roadblock/LC7/MglB family)